MSDFGEVGCVAVQSKGRHVSYQQIVERHTPPRPIIRNTIRAFFVGGGVCVLGQVVQTLFVRFAGFSPQDASNPTVAVMILLSVIATALGVYDKFAQWAGAGSAVPVTGFANTMASAAIECRSEGWVPGVGGNMFKLAGPVIVYGVVSAFFVSLVRYVVMHL
ncbi:stage V sporulation protein AC [Alicyclobacillus macrosporangiidus]|uniref:stage V sporulation protein AC n=1 Tax=Alicyclobacillus macrosporangiidus TaxID=392015 RepID=UPI000554B7CA|nr:stage V sporulation protein AC [Alicyclobacillus macrosporangiidus]MCL6597989.1 stage V sporulation protein AC [Alicyclobacillus macrosporangiidus]